VVVHARRRWHSAVIAAALAFLGGSDGVALALAVAGIVAALWVPRMRLTADASGVTVVNLGRRADLLARGTLDDRRDFAERFFDVLDERDAPDGVAGTAPHLPRRITLALVLLRLVGVLMTAAIVILVLLSFWKA